MPHYIGSIAILISLKNKKKVIFFENAALMSLFARGNALDLYHCDESLWSLRLSSGSVFGILK